MKIRSLKRFRRLNSKKLGRASNRSELLMDHEETAFQSWKELEQWLLWAGISPKAQAPVSHIGIYTDFT